MPELQAGLADRRGIHDRQETRRVGHQHLVEQRLVGVKQADKVDVAVQVGGFGRQLLHHPLDLRLFACRLPTAGARSGPTPRAPFR